MFGYEIEMERNNSPKGESDGKPIVAGAKIPPPAEAVPPRPAVPLPIRNPYITGRNSIGFYTKRNSNSNNDAISNSSNNTTPATSKYPSDVRKPPPTYSTPASSATLPSNDDNRKAPPQPSQQRDQQQHQQQNELAHWERLPSRNVSFSPAEILTITECLKDGQSIAKLYYEEGRSVRVTGILEERSTRFEDGRIGGGEQVLVVELEVRDPMTATTQAAAERAKAKHAAASFARKKRPSLSATPSSLTKPRSSAFSSSDERRRLRSKKRPWFVSSSITNKKGSLKTLKTKSSPPSAPSRTTLKVRVDAKGVPGADQSLAAAVVGSFVTVIGEFVALQTARGKAASIHTNESKVDAEPGYVLEARTLKVVNNRMEGSPGTKATTDMVFYEKALSVRRKSMYERYHFSSRRRTPIHHHNKLQLLQGCGPPPYDAFDRELEERHFGFGEAEREGPEAKHV